MSEIDELRAALKRCMPLVDQALEDCRQMRLRAGHSDIGAGTKHIGLWPFEVAARDNARALADSEKPSPDVLTTKRGPGELAETILDIARSGAR